MKSRLRKAPLEGLFVLVGSNYWRQNLAIWSRNEKNMLQKYDCQIDDTLRRPFNIKVYRGKTLMGLLRNWIHKLFSKSESIIHNYRPVMMFV